MSWRLPLLQFGLGPGCWSGMRHKRLAWGQARICMMAAANRRPGKQSFTHLSISNCAAKELHLQQAHKVTRMRSDMAVFSSTNDQHPSRPGYRQDGSGEQTSVKRFCACCCFPSRLGCRIGPLLGTCHGWGGGRWHCESQAGEQLTQ